MKFSYYISIILGVCLMAFTSCDQEEVLVAGQGDDATSKLELAVSSAGYNVVGTKASTVAYVTKFTNGDEVGIFAVRNGQVVENINNRKFVYDEGVWELEGDVIEYKGTDFKKMSFHAYYPFQEDVKFNPANEDPFDDLVKGWKVEADQSGDNYTNSDLMTSVGEAEGQRLQGKVTFVMEHRMALSIIEMPQLTYSFTNAGIEDYYLPVTIEEVSVTANGATTDGVKPYYDSATGTYMLLVNPESDFTVNGSYTGAKEMEYTINGNLASGSAKKYTIKDDNKITHTLAVGDYFLSNGMIVSKDAEEVPANCIGIVYYAGNPQPSATNPELYTETSDALLRDFPGATHGLVLAIKNAEMEDGTQKYKFADSQAYFSNWYKSDEEWSDKFINNEFRDVPAGFTGYNGTVLMDHSYKMGATTGCTHGWAFWQLYVDAVPVNAPTSGWYLPSAYELSEVAKSQFLINSKIKAVGGDELESHDGAIEAGPYYWAINERNNSFMWGHKMEGGADIAIRERGSRSGYFRMALAF